MIPTDEQIREFGEKCGWQRIEKKNVPVVLFEGVEPSESFDLVYWLAPDNADDDDWYEEPPIDLNNLFKYAVPKAVHILFENGRSMKHAYNKLFKLWLKKWAEGCEFEDALFWAIREVLNGNTD